MDNVEKTEKLPTFLQTEFDPRDPSPWLALYLDQSTPLPDHVKQAWLTDSATPSRQFLLPFVRPIARTLIVLIQIVKVVVPRNWAASKLLHWILATGLKHFVRPEANWLVLRHFQMGAQILADNCGQTFEKVMKDFDRDYWMDASESVAYGIVDGVLDKI